MISCHRRWKHAWLACPGSEPKHYPRDPQIQQCFLLRAMLLNMRSPYLKSTSGTKSHSYWTQGSWSGFLLFFILLRFIVFYFISGKEKSKIRLVAFLGGERGRECWVSRCWSCLWGSTVSWPRSRCKWPTVLLGNPFLSWGPTSPDPVLGCFCPDWLLTQGFLILPKDASRTFQDRAPSMHGCTQV